MKTLQEIYKNYTTPDGNGDKGTAHSYIEVYEEILKPYRNGCSFMEIGVSQGLSMEMWADYFENSNLIGSDIKCQSDEIRNNKRYKFIESDATKPDFINKIGDTKFDVIIDDGSHKKEDQINSYNLLKDRLNEGGIYVIEDVLDLDKVRDEFLNLDKDKKIDILDRRKIKNRNDDVLIVIKNK